MPNFNDDDLQNMSIEQINELYNDIIEMPSPMIAGIAYLNGVCYPKGGWLYSQ